ncbi:MAG: radical SAM protein [Firmicutes bacterium]|nr:radical SAM protein [Bacillota bacterium]
MKTSDLKDFKPRVVVWESTRACNLACVHCRAEACHQAHPDELETGAVMGFIDDLASFCKPLLIISGGEPLLRKDVFEVAAYANQRGLPAVMSPNGTLVEEETVRRMREAGLRGISISLDGSTSERHDRFRKAPGAFEAAVKGIKKAVAGGIPCQVNTTLTRANLDDLPFILDLALSLKAFAWDVFMLVPTGRGRVEDEVTPSEYEEALIWLRDQAVSAPIPVKVTCGPHFTRVVDQRKETEAASGSIHDPRGCMAGNGFCFVSHIGEVFPCGYLPLLAGKITEQPFSRIYRESELLALLRDPSLLKGKCGRCGYRRKCMGCRARAFAVTGDYLEEEPFCVYQP